jgi:hypothetical protein
MGTYLESYDTVSMARTLIDSIYQMSRFQETIAPDAYCRGLNQFLMWDWGGFDGLVNADASKNESYYAFRLAARAMRGAKDRLVFSSSDAAKDLMVTADAGNYYVFLQDVGAAVDLDLYSLGVDSGSAQVYEYSASARDALVATVPIVLGEFSVTAPAAGVLCVVVPRP